MPSLRILLVDDEPDILELVRFHLEQEGYAVETAATGSAALDSLRRGPPDLAVLDVMLPDLSGTEVLRVLRAQPETRQLPVILLTARTEEVDRVVGFELGADDYVPKPFSPRELVLRIRAILRRRGQGQGDAEVFELGPLRLDAGRHRCAVAGEEVELTAKEFGLLEVMMARPGRVFSRELLLAQVWGDSVHVTPRTVDTHVKRLREKLGAAGDCISTVRGVGYRLDT
jgi:two-component system phosphate regulon response regulator PhoB